MKILGAYEEFWGPAAGELSGSVRDFVQAVPSPHEEHIAAYLRNGHQLVTTMGVVDDVFGSGETILGGSSIYTDGEWVWRGDLWFYVSQYHVRLPDDFITKAQKADFMPAHVGQKRLLELTDEIVPLL